MQPAGVEARLVHADETDRGEVVLKGAEIVLRVGIKPGVEELGDNGALGLERAGRDVHHVVEPLIELVLGLGEIGDARHVDRHDADRAGALAGAEEAAGFLAQLAQIQPQTAAHRAHVARLHVGVDVVGEVRRAVLGGHLEEKAVVLGLAPVKILGDGVGRDRVLEAAAVGVALGHDLDERLVHHVHFLLAVAVGEVLLLAADDRGQIAQVGRNGPVERDVGERRLRAPAGRRVHAEDERLDALLDFLLRELVHAHERREIGVERGKGLRARPFVLHDAEEVDHLVAQRAQMARRGGVDLARNAETLLDELLQTPAGAVAGEHAQIVQMQIAVAVGVGDLFVVHLAQPVVGGDRAGVRENETADGVGDGGVFLHTPVVDLEIVIDGLLIVEYRVAHGAEILVLLAVENVRLGNVLVAAAGEDALNAVLDILDVDELVGDLRLEIRRDHNGQKIDDALVIIGFGGVKRLFHRVGDLADLKVNDPAVALHNPVHSIPPYISIILIKVMRTACPVRRAPL